MSGKDDPFEMLRKKLEAKKKEQKGKGGIGPFRAASARPSAGRPEERKPTRVARVPTLAGSWLDDAAEPGEEAAAPSASAPPRPDAGEIPKIQGLQKHPWAKEDVEKMRRSRETTKDGPPEGYRSHRFDSELDPTKGLTKPKGQSKPGPRPKGFSSDRADRG